MTRTAFFSALSALLATVAAKAQSTIITPCRPKIAWGNQVPLCNGQCPNPECDFRAEPFPTNTLPITEAAGFTTYPIEFYQSWYYSNHKDVTTGPRLLRCPKCNSAFWQDPEPKQ